MEYVFEPLSEEGHFQVRLGGEFVTYTDHQDPAKVDARIQEAGYTSREHFYNESVIYNSRVTEMYKKKMRQSS